MTCTNDTGFLGKAYTKGAKLSTLEARQSRCFVGGIEPGAAAKLIPSHRPVKLRAIKHSFGDHSAPDTDGFGKVSIVGRMLTFPTSKPSGSQKCMSSHLALPEATRHSVHAFLNAKDEPAASPMKKLSARFIGMPFASARTYVRRSLCKVP